MAAPDVSRPGSHLSRPFSASQVTPAFPGLPRPPPAFFDLLRPFFDVEQNQNSTIGLTSAVAAAVPVPATAGR
ncbi:hypothetical protein CcI156_05175 [Frankia sp. CcI156]|uniref:hypothetical protein n=1 Tax=unclassified Frankia TaxID=2632575 RepID=UPI0004068CE4|nr:MULTISPECIES: hypothetical protein [unclassified Frankia]OFB45218.1 hypothetical protein Manayef4_05845 [Frankia sp. CgIM4]OHV57759.1 hypothetical protein CgIS1_01095 [Frankia sp. CgIS1]ONH28595.1 hypothetical protein CcI156_05175 [Frankia sp. CcI156]ORT98605.1 hypothetical protein UK99_00940 [Frankia casuarinae]